MCIVTLPSGVSVNQIDGVKPDMASALAVPLPRTGRPMLIKVPAAVATERTRNSRRVVEDGVNLSMTRSLIRGLGGPIHDLAGPLDGTDDARVGGAATEIAGHAVDDLLLGRIRILRKQRRGLHDLAGLAVAALRHLVLDPRLLYRVGIDRVQALNGRDH